MSAADIELRIFSRATRAETVEQRHAEIMERMVNIGAPLGFSGVTPPPAPEFGNMVIASYRVRLPLRGLKCEGQYLYRGGNFHYEDNAKFDDSLRYDLRFPTDPSTIGLFCMRNFRRLSRRFVDIGPVVIMKTTFRHI
jgi:hypothetical protein